MDEISTDVDTVFREIIQICLQSIERRVSYTAHLPGDIQTDLQIVHTACIGILSQTTRDNRGDSLKLLKCYQLTVEAGYAYRLILRLNWQN